MDELIFKYIEKDTINEILTAFQTCVGLRVQLLSEQGNAVIVLGDPTPYCDCFQKVAHPAKTCFEVHKKSAARALDIGEAYIFSCHANCNHIVFPIVNNELLLGSVLVGPFLMDSPDMMMMSDVAKRHSMGTTEILELYEASSTLPVIQPDAATQISRLLSYLFAGVSLNNSEHLKVNREKTSQQSRIGESIQKYKALDSIKTIHYPVEKERQLLHKVKTGNIEDVRALLNDLLGYVLFSSGSTLSQIKVRAIELISLLSRTAIEGGAKEEEILSLSYDFSQKMDEIDNDQELCYRLQGLVESFMRSMFPQYEKMNSDAIQNAIAYIGQNYSANITLDKVSRHVYLSPAYFSSIFKQATGKSFKEYLTGIRIEETKRLLSTTDYTILDIAVSCGFDNQSYFTKVFKKYTGLSPKQYRTQK